MYEDTLNANNYLQFLRGPMLGFFDESLLNELRQLWWQQDGAPPHNGVLVPNYLNKIFPNHG